MGLHPLEPGLAPDRVEKLRWIAFAHKRPLRLRSASDLQRFVTTRGFVLHRPEVGVVYPTALEATCGRPLHDFTWDERAATLQAWIAQACAARRLVVGGLARRRVLMTPGRCAELVAAAGAGSAAEKRTVPAGVDGLGDTARAVAAALDAGGRATEAALAARLAMQAPVARKRLRAALQEAMARSVVVEAGLEPADPANPGAGAVMYELLQRLHPAVVRKAGELDPGTARRRIALRYLRNVLLSGEGDLARLVGWERGGARQALEDLVSRRLARVHPASRPNRTLFQACATDVLPPDVLAEGRA